MVENPFDYFIGMPVTVVTLGSSLRFSPENHLNYFVGILLSVDEWTCTLRHPVTGSRSLFRLEHIVSIHEEQQVDPTCPEDQRMLQEQDARREEFKKHNPNLFQVPQPEAPRRPAPPPEMVAAPVPPVKIKPQETPFVDLDQLQTLAKQSRRKP